MNDRKYYDEETLQPNKQENNKCAKSLFVRIFLFLLSFMLGYGFILMAEEEYCYDLILYPVCWFLGIVSYLWFIFEMVKLIRTISKAVKATVKYKERCYKRINRIHSYYESGAVTEEEFNNLKQEILRKIK